MDQRRDELLAALDALEAKRAVLGDAVVDSSSAPLRAALAALADDDATRLKQVSVLFVDVVGSTALGSRLDPEDINDLLDPLLCRLTECVTLRGGHVAKYTGDGLVATFGAHHSSDLDAERAVDAGLAMLAAGGPELRVRVGIDTGPVLIGGGIEGDASLRGSTVNTAARMEQTAPAGGLRISASTHALVRDRFLMVEQAPIAVKGIDEPVVTYLVERALPRRFHAVTERAPMTGRDEPLAELHAAAAECASAATPRWVIVVGEAGLGKSRLLREFVAAAPAPFRARADPRHTQQPYGLVRNMVLEHCRLTDDDAPAAVHHTLAAALDAASSSAVASQDDHPQPARAADGAGALAHLIGIDAPDGEHTTELADARLLREQALTAMATLVHGQVAPGRPVIVVLEDLHWADEASLAMLRALCDRLGDVGLLVIASARPELLTNEPAVLADLASRRIVLEPLDDAGSAALADALLARLGGDRGDLRQLVVDRAGGNPFFMEELVRMLLDVGAVIDSGDRWTVARDRLHDLDVPTTVFGVLQARFDALPPPQRTALQMAAVIGNTVWDRALATFGPTQPETLTALVAGGFLVEHPTSMIAGAREYAFRHHLLLQFTYRTLLKRDRREYHGRAAAWFAPIGEARGAEYLGVTGDHYERAGQAALAADYYLRASAAASGRDAVGVAMDYIERAVPLVDGGDLETLWRLASQREQLLALGKHGARHADALDELDDLADALDDDHRRGHVDWRRCTTLYEAGHHLAAREIGLEALKRARTAGDDHLLARMLAEMAAIELRLDRGAEAVALSVEGLACARRTGDAFAEVRLLLSLSGASAALGALREAEEHATEACDRARAAGDGSAEANALNRLGGLAFRRGDIKGACDRLAESVAIARRIGDIYGQCIATLNLSGNVLLLGDVARSFTLAHEALALARRAGTRDLEAATLVQVGLTNSAAEEWDDAIAAHEQACELFELNDSPQYCVDPLAGLAEAHLGRGDVARAAAYADEVVRFIEADAALNTADDPPAVFWRCYQALERAGDPRAQWVLGAAHRALMDSIAGLSPDQQDRFLAQPHAAAPIMAAWTSQQGTSHQSGGT